MMNGISRHQYEEEKWVNDRYDRLVEIIAKWCNGSDMKPGDRRLFGEAMSDICANELIDSEIVHLFAEYIKR